VHIRCWHCGRDEAELERERCAHCGQLLRPNPDQREVSQDRILYLLSELRLWKSVPDWWKKEAEANYRARLERLANIPAEGLLVEAVAPESLQPAAAAREVALFSQLLKSNPDPSSESAPARPRKMPRPDRQAEVARELEQMLNPSGEEPAPQPGAPSEADVAMQMLMETFSEKKIHLLYALGGILLLAAGVGILRSSWEGWGRQAVALLLTLLPVGFFWMARQLQEKLPVSSRMFNVLGGAMLPVGVLFLNSFNVAGLQISSQFWNPLAFLIGWGANHRLAKRRQEPICAYLAGLCWGLAGWATGNSMTLGLFSFGGAMALFWKEPHEPHFTRVAHGLSALGLLAAFTRGPLESGTAATLFLLAVVYFTTRALVINTGAAMGLSSLICLLCAAWLSHLLNWPHSSVGLAALLQGLLYIRRGPTGESIAIYLTGLVLLLFLGLPLLAQLPTNFQGIQDSQLLTGCLTGALGALFYGFCAYRYRRSNWVYGASLCSLYAYMLLLALMMRTQPALYRPWLVALALLWQVAVALLRRRIPETYLRPWVWTAAGLSLLLIPLNLVMQMAGADPYTPWVYLGVTAVTALSALFEHNPQGLYLSMITSALAYASWLPIFFGHSQQPNLGLAFTAFVAALALLGLALKRQPSTQAYATPLLISAALAGWGFSTMQVFYLSLGYWSSASAALIFYGLGFVLARHRYAHLQGALCLLTAIACLDHFGPVGVGIALAGCGVLMVWARPGLLEAAFLWSAAASALGPSSLKIMPALLWLAAAARPSHLSQKDRETLAQVSSLLLLPALGSCWKAAPNLGLALACAAQIALAVRWKSDNLIALAWLQLKVCYFCALGWASPATYSLILGGEWAMLYALSGVLKQPAVALETLTAMGILGLSAFTHGATGALTPWLVALALMARSRQAARADLDVLAQAAVIWASLRCAILADYAPLFSVLMFAWSYLNLALGRPQNMKFMSILGWLGSMAATGPVERTTVLCLGAGAWAWHARQEKSALWGAFGMLYHAYVGLLLHLQVSSLEMYVVPAALWLMAWGSLFTDQASYRQMGLLTLIGPSLFLSLFSVEHALWTGSLGLGLLLGGQLSQRGVYQAWGALALLSEVTIQAAWAARNLPWHQWAVVGGLILVGLAFLVERKRQQVMQASRSFLSQLGAW